MKPICLFFLLATILGMSACKVQEEIKFNKDLSGRLNYTLDLNAVRGFAEQMRSMNPNADSSGTSPKDMFEELDNITQSPMYGYLKEIQGLSDVETKFDEGVLRIGFSFKDLNALNKAYNLMATQSKFDLGKTGFKEGNAPTDDENPLQNIPNFTYFAQKGKYLIIKRPSAGGSKKSKSDNPMEKLSAQMGAMFEYQNRITFDGSVIKSVKASNVKFTQNANELIIKGDAQEVMNQASEIKIKLK